MEQIQAKVPIITGLYKSTNIHVDISLFKKNGVDVAVVINKINNIYPEIKYLILVIKYLIRQRNLNQIYFGGISSFIIFSLLYYYISDLKKQIQYEIKNGKIERMMTLGHLLVGFFNFLLLNLSMKNLEFLYRMDVIYMQGMMIIKIYYQLKISKMNHKIWELIVIILEKY